MIRGEEKRLAREWLNPNRAASPASGSPRGRLSSRGSPPESPSSAPSTPRLGSSSPSAWDADSRGKLQRKNLGTSGGGPGSPLAQQRPIVKPSPMDAQPVKEAQREVKAAQAKVDELRALIEWRHQNGRQIWEDICANRQAELNAVPDTWRYIESSVASLAYLAEAKRRLRELCDEFEGDLGSGGAGEDSSFGESDFGSIGGPRKKNGGSNNGGNGGNGGGSDSVLYSARQRQHLTTSHLQVQIHPQVPSSPSSSSQHALSSAARRPSLTSANGGDGYGKMCRKLDQMREMMGSCFGQISDRLDALEVRTAKIESFVEKMPPSGYLYAQEKYKQKHGHGYYGGVSQTPAGGGCLTTLREDGMLERTYSSHAATAEGGAATASGRKVGRGGGSSYRSMFTDDYL